MKKDNFFVLGMLVMALGLILAGCATSTGGGDDAVRGDDGIPKTIIITGFDLQLEGTRSFWVVLTGDWDDERNDWIIPANSKEEVDGQPSLILDGQTLTVPLWNYDDNELLTRWTGTGEYGINFHIFPSTEHGTVETYRYLYNMPGKRTVDIKDAETTVTWSDFVFGWTWED